mgnify:CR=1 FL=1
MNIVKRLYDWMLSWGNSRWGALALFLFAFMAISIAAFGLMLITMKRKKRILCGTLVLLLCVILSLQTFGVLALPAVAITAVLICIYSVMGIGLYV